MYNNPITESCPLEALGALKMAKMTPEARFCDSMPLFTIYQYDIAIF